MRWAISPHPAHGCEEMVFERSVSCSSRGSGSSRRPITARRKRLVSAQRDLFLVRVVATVDARLSRLFSRSWHWIHLLFARICGHYGGGLRQVSVAIGRNQSGWARSRVPGIPALESLGGDPLTGLNPALIGVAQLDRADERLFD